MNEMSRSLRRCLAELHAKGRKTKRAITIIEEILRHYQPVGPASVQQPAPHMTWTPAARAKLSRSMRRAWKKRQHSAG
jgi:hypothetical protein